MSAPTAAGHLSTSYFQSPTFYQLPLLWVAASRASPWAWPLTVPHLTPHPVSRVHLGPCQPFSSSWSPASESNPASTADFFSFKIFPVSPFLLSFFFSALAQSEFSSPTLWVHKSNFQWLYWRAAFSPY